MQEVCAILERLVHEGTLSQYAIGGATAAAWWFRSRVLQDVAEGLWFLL